MDNKEIHLIEKHIPTSTPCVIYARICNTCGVGLIIEIPSLSKQGIIVNFEKTAQWELEQAGWESYWCFGRKYRCNNCIQARCKSVIENS